ncbi:Gfo/Idh/MocA family oxidoreductase [Candidatus Latescibacterota bacterium]
MVTTEIAPIRVGVLACGRYVHTRGIWGPIMHPEVGGGPSASGTRRTAMAITHVWDVDGEAADEFAGAFPGVQVVGDYWDMVGKVDGIILDDFDSCLHFRELARPYLEAGMPMFINRPFALNLEHAREIVDLAVEHDAPIMSASSFEFAPEMEYIRKQVAEVEPLSGYCAANSMSDYATHGIHGVFFAHTCVGGGVRRVAYQTPDWHTPNGIVILEHEAREGGRPFYGCVQEISGTWGWIRAFGTRSFEEAIHPGEHFWPPLVLEMQKLFETRRMPQSYDEILSKVRTFLAGFRSHLDCGGAPVGVDELGDWTAPLLNPDPYPDGFFS